MIDLLKAMGNAFLMVCVIVGVIFLVFWVGLWGFALFFVGMCGEGLKGCLMYAVIIGVNIFNLFVGFTVQFLAQARRRKQLGDTEYEFLRDRGYYNDQKINKTAVT